MGNKIFISYRRSDSSGPAGRLYDRLEAHFGRENVFMDVDDIPPGMDFVEVLDQAVAESKVLLLVIGKQWNTVSDEKGLRRLDNPEDFVRLEAESALRRGLRVIPVLVDGARMPSSAELPEGLKPLTRRQAAQLDHASFKTDAERLIQAMEEYLNKQEGGQRSAASKPQPKAETEGVGLVRKETDAGSGKMTNVQSTSPADAKIGKTAKMKTDAPGRQKKSPAVAPKKVEQQKTVKPAPKQKARPIRASLVRKTNLSRVIRVQLPEGTRLVEFTWKFVAMLEKTIVNVDGRKATEGYVFRDKKGKDPRPITFMKFVISTYKGRKRHAEIHWRGLDPGKRTILPEIESFCLEVSGKQIYAENPEKMYKY